MSVVTMYGSEVSQEGGFDRLLRLTRRVDGRGAGLLDFYQITRVVRLKNVESSSRLPPRRRSLSVSPKTDVCDRR